MTGRKQVVASIFRGERVAERRKILNYEIKDVLALLKERGIPVDRTHLQRIETGEKFPGLGLFYGLVVVLETNADYFLGLTDDPKPASDLADQVVIGVDDEQERQIIQEIVECALSVSRREQEMILHLLRRLSQTGADKYRTREADEVDEIMRTLPLPEREKIITFARATRDEAVKDKELIKKRFAAILLAFNDKHNIDATVVFEEVFDVLLGGR